MAVPILPVVSRLKVKGSPSASVALSVPVTIVSSMVVRVLSFATGAMLSFGTLQITSSEKSLSLLVIS